MTVRVMDAGVDGPALNATASCVLTVTNVNEAPWFTSSLFSFSAAQNSPYGQVVGTVSALDQDYGDTLTYSLSTQSATTTNNTFGGVTTNGTISGGAPVTFTVGHTTPTVSSSAATTTTGATPPPTAPPPPRRRPL